jgi:hypothetical protein
VADRERDREREREREGGGGREHGGTRNDVTSGGIFSQKALRAKK